jgi:hypothetical protein
LVSEFTIEKDNLEKIAELLDGISRVSSGTMCPSRSGFYSVAKTGMPKIAAVLMSCLPAPTIVSNA